MGSRLGSGGRVRIAQRRRPDLEVTASVPRGRTPEVPPATPHPNASLDWSAVDDQAVKTVKALAMDSVQKVGNGHPGTAMSLAPAAYLVFQKLMRHNPADPDWAGRDRFVLSCGHSSLTLYIQLYLAGYGLQLADLEALRTWGSQTPGHPEHGHTAGVETTTGPLGQGVGNAVGMAMAARRERGLFDPDPRSERACSTTTSTSSPATATSKRGSAPRRPRSPGTSSSATSSCCTTTTRSRSRTTLRSPSAKTSPSDTRRTAGTSSMSTGPTAAPATTRTSRRCSTLIRPRRPRRPAELHRSPHHHRVAGPVAAEHRQGPRVGPRRRRGRGDQEGPRLRPRPLVRRGRRGH